MKTLLKSLLVFILLGISTCCSARTYSYKNKIEVNESTIVKIKVHYRIDSYVDNKAVNKWIFILIDELIENKVIDNSELLKTINDFKEELIHIDNRNNLNRKTQKKYDLVFKIDTFPIILHKSKLLKFKSRTYSKICERIEQFTTWNQNWIYNTAVFRPNIYQQAKMRGKNCVNCINFDNFVDGLRQDFIYNIQIPDSYTKTLKKYGLQEKKFITLNRGSYTIPGQGEGTRVWPLEYYNKLIKLLKKHYPEYKIVQLGQTEDIPKMDNVDLCLCGKTDMDELKTLLFGAFLHIDGEGGMVHLRKAMDAGPSVVLFGSTDPEYFGHATNINLRSNVCPYACCEMHDLWLHKCLKSENGLPLCLLSLTPENVFENIQKYIENNTLPNEPWKKSFYATTQDLLQDKRFTLDKDWVMMWLRYQKIHGYSLEEIKLSDILYWKQINEKGDGTILPLTEAANPMTAILNGDADTYNAYNKMKENTKNDKFHCEARCVNLISQLDETEYDIKNGIIVVDCNNILMDGFHRSTYLLNKYGPDHKILVCKLTDKFH